MNANLRLGLIIVGFIVAGALIWTTLGGSDTEPPTQAPIAVTSDPSQEPDFDTDFDDSPPSAHTPSAPEATATLAAAGSTSTKATTNAKLKGEFIVNGKVLQPDESPAPGASIVLYKYDYQEFDLRSEKHLRAEYTADANGEFTIEGLEQGSLILSARYESMAAIGHPHVSEWSPTANITLKLEPAATISGTVVNGEGEPVAGVLVAPGRKEDRPKNSRGGEFHMSRTETKEDGVFTLEGLSDGRWDIFAFSDDYATAEVKGVASGTDALEIVLEGGGALGGIVISENTLEPIEGVQVVAGYTDYFSDRHNATSDVEGRFNFATLRAGEYNIMIDDEIRVLTHRLEPVAVVADQEWDGLELKVAEGGVVTGRVYDEETGRGIAGTVVNASPNNSNIPNAIPNPHRKGEPSGTDGSFRIAGLGDAKYQLYLERVSGYPSNNQKNRVSIVSSPGREVAGVDFPLERGLNISGRVTDAQGKPVPGASVVGRSDNWEARDNGTSRADGRFELSGFTLSDVYVWAEHKGMISKVEGPIKLHETSGDNIALKLEDKRNCTIAGEVVDSNGRPLAEVNVWLNASDRKHFNLSSPQTGEDGKFELNELPPGTYSLRCSSPGGHNQGGEYPEPIELKDGERRDGIRIVVEATEGLTITGRVVDQEGKPIRGVGINGWIASGGGRSVYSRSDEEGFFELKGLEDEDYRLFFQSHRYSRVELDAVAAGTRDLEIKLLASTTIRGRIIDAESGEPIPEFEVQAVQGRQSQMQGWYANNMSRFFDPEGFFETTTDYPGNVTIIARAQGYAPVFHPLSDVEAASTIDNIEIALEAGSIVNGIVIDDNGDPVSNANIYIGEVPDKWQRDRVAATTSDDNGTFTLDGLGKDDRLVSAWHPAYSAGSSRVPFRRSKPAEVEIVLSKGGIIQGLITIGGQPPNGRAFINYTPENQDQQYGEVNPDGTYEVTGLSPGPVEVTGYLRINDDSNRRIERQAIVASEEITQVDFDFPELNATMEGRVMIGDAPATSGSVRATVQTTAGEESFRGSIQPDGSYRIEAMAGGSAELRVTGSTEDARGETTLTRNVSPNTTTTQDFDLQKYIRITGRVAGGIANERGVAAFRGHLAMSTPVTPAQLLELDRSRVDRFTHNNQPGPFEYNLDLPGPGEYTLAAYSTDGGDAASLAAMAFSTVYITVQEGETLEIDMEIP